MRICITLDDVLRNKTKQLIKIYKKNIDNNFDDTIEMETNNYYQYLNFDTKREYNKFLYEDFVFEIFGEANATQPTVDKKLNLWLLNINEDDDIEENIDVFFGNAKEYNASIGCTHFFLSKMATRIRETHFPTDSITLWDKCDVMITAEPYLIDNKPEGKKVVKIETSYNKTNNADYTYKSLNELLDDTEFIKNITKNNGQEN